jgi:hypothetical protein
MRPDHCVAGRVKVSDGLDTGAPPTERVGLGHIVLERRVVEEAVAAEDRGGALVERDRGGTEIQGPRSVEDRCVVHE